MINILFSDSNIQALQDGRLRHPHHHVSKKMDALYFKSQKIPHKDICRITGITEPALVNYLRDYREGGIEKLREINFYRPESALEGHETLIRNYFEQHPPANLAEARQKIENLTGVDRSTSQVRIFLRRLGMKCRKTGSIPGKAVDDDKIEEQEDFKKNLSLVLKKRKRASASFSSSMRRTLFMERFQRPYGVSFAYSSRLLPGESE